MAFSANYEPDRAGWNRFAMSRDVGDACVHVAEEAMTYAQGVAPVDTGDYKSHFAAAPTVATWGRWGPRAAAEMWNDSGHAPALEFGNSRARKRGIFAQTVTHLSGGAT